MSLTILSVAYPLAPAGPDAVGGAEQILSELDRALVLAGHRSVVVACEGSQVMGSLIATPRIGNVLDAKTIAAARERHCRAIVAALERWPIDIVHMHGIDFHSYLPPAGASVLVTLHGPASWYSRDVLQPSRPNTWLHCVSAQQHATVVPNAHLLAPIENGVRVDAFAAHSAKREFTLVLSRIAPEKGVHLAIDAAKRAEVPLLIAGRVFEYPEHLRYFREQIAPRLDRRRRFIGSIGFARKRRLLATARCLIVASSVPETSSLAAREALAAGTPVVALRSGALVDTIEQGRTGFLVDDEHAMAEAIRMAGALDSGACRRVARDRFSLEKMLRQYFAVYDAITASRCSRMRVGAA